MLTIRAPTRLSIIKSDNAVYGACLQKKLQLKFYWFISMPKPASHQSIIRVIKISTVPLIVMEIFLLLENYYIAKFVVRFSYKYF